MSREFLWEYQIPGPDAGAKYEVFWGSPSADCFCEKVACHTEIQGGSGNASSGYYEITLWANKSKARRIAARLDEHFAGRGVLSLWDPS